MGAPRRSSTRARLQTGPFPRLVLDMFRPRHLHFAGAVMLAITALAGCPQNDTKGEGTPEPGTPSKTPSALLQDVTHALDTRAAAIIDYDVEGTIDDGATQKLRFRYAMKQPAFSAGELLSADGTRLRAFIFDGTDLAIVDDGTKTLIRKRLATDEEALLLTLHEIFSPFVCEGWRPPLIKPTGTVATANDDGSVELVVPVDGEGLKEQALHLGRDGSFLGKELRATDGSVVASVAVLKSAKDATTGLSFPVVWEAMERGTKGTVTLSSYKVNVGVPAARFETTVPAGYTERVQPSASPESPASPASPASSPSLPSSPASPASDAPAAPATPDAKATP